MPQGDEPIPELRSWRDVLRHGEEKCTAAAASSSSAKAATGSDCVVFHDDREPHYHWAYRKRPEGHDYFRSRSLDDPEMLAAFEVGYVDGTRRATFDDEGETVEALKAAGVVNGLGREHFLGCIVVPRAFPDVGVVGFHGRHMKRDQQLYLPGRVAASSMGRRPAVARQRRGRHSEAFQTRGATPLPLAVKTTAKERNRGGDQH